MTPEEANKLRDDFEVFYAKARDCLVQLHAHSDIPHYDNWFYVLEKQDRIEELEEALKKVLLMLETTTPRGYVRDIRLVCNEALGSKKYAGT